MNFKSHKGELKHLYLPPRSLYILTGESRYAWFHSISERRTDRAEGQTLFRRRRISLTYRSISHVPCTCKWHFFCDSRGFEQAKFKFPEYLQTTNQGVGLEKSPENIMVREQNELLVDQKNQNKNGEGITKRGRIEKEFVHEVYERIAGHFSDTRYNPWPAIKKFLLDLERHSIVVDVGCGNGKYLGVNPDLVMIGTDITLNLLKICQSRDFNVFSADNLNLPIKTGYADHAISIAVIHHFSTDELRLRAMEEILRIVKTGGTALISAWALEQQANKSKNFDGQNQDIFVPWNLNNKHHKSNLEKGLEKVGVMEELETRTDVFLNPSQDTLVYKRYYHLFKQGELEALVNTLNSRGWSLSLEESFYERDNWFVVVKINHHLGSPENDSPN